MGNLRGPKTKKVGRFVGKWSLPWMVWGYYGWMSLVAPRCFLVVLY